MATASNSSGGAGGPPPSPPLPPPATTVRPPLPAAAAQGPGRPLRSGLIPWAEREVGVPAADGPVAVRAALVARLEAETFFPSPAVQYAFETLAIGSDRLKGIGLEPPAGEYYVAAEKSLREEVESFAREYFRIEPAARAERWRTLWESSADFPAPASRLKQLHAGLDAVSPPADAEPVLKSLAEHLTELFTSTPHERARRRRFPDERFQTFVTRWPAAAARLRQQFPKVAALDPQLIDQLTKSKQLSTRGYASPGVRTSERTARISDYAVHESDPDSRGRRRQSREQAGMSAGRFIWIALVVFGMFARFLTGSSRNDSRPPSTYGGSNYSTDGNSPRWYGQPPEVRIPLEFDPSRNANRPPSDGPQRWTPPQFWNPPPIRSPGGNGPSNAPYPPNGPQQPDVRKLLSPSDFLPPEIHSRFGGPAAPSSSPSP